MKSIRSATTVKHVEDADETVTLFRIQEILSEHRAALIDCLVGDVLKDMRPFTEALSQMTPPPAPLLAAA